MTSTGKALERVQLTDTRVKVVMPEKVFNQVRYLCKEIPKVEWSGVLYYKVEGSIKDPANMILTLEEILPLNKGTSLYTEYEFGEAFVEHMMENEHLEDCKMGHIHSHNVIDVFFSGTDWSELEDNAPNHNFYLSLIVNNFMDFCAKVCFIAESADKKKFDFTAKDENGEIYVYNSEDYTVKNKKLVVYDCDIDAPYNNIIVDDSFKRKVENIIKEADRKPVRTIIQTMGLGTKRTTPAYGQVGKNWDPTVNMYHQGWHLGNIIEEEEEEEDADAILEDAIEDFSMLILNTGNDITQFHNIADIIKNYKGYNLSGRALAKGVLDKYVQVYEKFFEELPEKDDPKMFMRITEQTIENLEDERDSSTLKYMKEMLNPTIKGLRVMLESFKNFEKVN